MTPGISWGGVGVRIVLALALVLLTFNPTGYSFFHWVTAPPGLTALKAVAGVVLLIGWVMCLRATAISLGWLGVLLGAALLASLVWLLIELKMIDTVDGSVLTWIALVMVGILLGIGLSWSLIRARLMGHVEVQ
jgi:hypothetical protein